MRLMMQYTIMDRILLIVHNQFDNICDLCLFIAACMLGDNMQPFIHWLTTGSLPPWIEQLFKASPGICVALWHIHRIRRDKKKNDKNQ